jgi:tRNA(fMet)-specific endonuclease VapC
MAKKSLKLVLIDSGVVFEYLKGNEEVRYEILEVIGIENVFTSSIVVLETYYGMLKKEESDTKLFFKQIGQIVIDKETCQKAIGLMLSYRGNKVALPDCLIGATCIVNSIELYTFNKKDFDYVKGIKIYKPKGLRRQ